MYALWCVLAVSVLCESLAQQWQVWVRDTSSRSIWLATTVCWKALCRYRSRVSSIHHPDLRLRDRSYPNPRLALDSLQFLVSPVICQTVKADVVGSQSDLCSPLSPCKSCPPKMNTTSELRFIHRQVTCSLLSTYTDRPVGSYWSDAHHLHLAARISCLVRFSRQGREGKEEHAVHLPWCRRIRRRCPVSNPCADNCAREASCPRQQTGEVAQYLPRCQRGEE
jgi:hypothetical protein